MCIQILKNIFLIYPFGFDENYLLILSDFCVVFFFKLEQRQRANERDEEQIRMLMKVVKDQKQDISKCKFLRDFFFQFNWSP